MTTTARKLSFLILLSALLSSPAWAEDPSDSQKMEDEMKKYRFETVTTKEGFKFSIPSDMPIERKDGLVAPIPFEEYLYIKFKMIEERIGKMEKRLDSMEGKLLAKIEEVKELQIEAAKMAEAAAAQPEPQPAS